MLSRPGLGRRVVGRLRQCDKPPVGVVARKNIEAVDTGRDGLLLPGITRVVIVTIGEALEATGVATAVETPTMVTEAFMETWAGRTLYTPRLLRSKFITPKSLANASGGC
jgi:hypothetical protein